MMVKTELEPRTVGESIRDLKAMLQQPGWTDHMLPLIQKMEREHTESAINPGLNQETRAQHIEAIHALRKLADYPEDRIKELEASWKQSQRKSPSA